MEYKAKRKKIGYGKKVGQVCLLAGIGYLIATIYFVGSWIEDLDENESSIKSLAKSLGLSSLTPTMVFIFTLVIIFVAFFVLALIFSIYRIKDIKWSNANLDISPLEIKGEDIVVRRCAEKEEKFHIHLIKKADIHKGDLRLYRIDTNNLVVIPAIDNPEEALSEVQDLISSWEEKRQQVLEETKAMEEPQDE